MSYANLLGTDGKIQPQYLPALGPTTPQNLEDVLTVGNQTGGITIQANTPGFDGEMTTDIINLTTIKPLGFPLVSEIGIEADVVFPVGAKVRFEDEAVIQSDTNVYKLVDVPQSGSALPNVLAYDPTTEQVFYQAVGAGSTAVNNVNTPAGDTSLTITPNTGNVKVSLPVVATAGTTAYPDSIEIDDRGRVLNVVAGNAKVESVVAGTNISVSGTATAPVVNLDITSAVDFNGELANNVSAVWGVPGNVLSISAFNEVLSLSAGLSHQIVADSELSAQKGIALAGLNSPLLAVGGPTPAGSVGQYLTSQGPGATPAWTTALPTGVQTVSAGTNITLTGTTTDPIVNVNINSTLDMNGNNISEASLIESSTTNLVLKPGTGQKLTLKDSTNMTVLETAGLGGQINLGTTLNANYHLIANALGVGGNLTLVGNNLSLDDQTGNSLATVSLPTYGQVDSVIAGSNINITGSATDPVVNLNDAIGVKAVGGVAGFDLNITPAPGKNIHLNDPTANTLLLVGNSGIVALNSIDMNENSLNNTQSVIGPLSGPLQITAGLTQNVVISGADAVAPVQGIVVEPTQVGVYLPLNMATNAITDSAGVGATLDLVGTTLSLKDQQGATLNSVVIPGGSGSVNSVSAGTNISVSGTATDPVVNLDIQTTVDAGGNNFTNVGIIGVQELQQGVPIKVGTAGFDLQNTGALYRTSAVVGATTQPLNITAGVGQDLHLNDNIGNTKVAITTTTTEVYNNIDMNNNYIQEVSNISGTNSLGPGGRVITVSAIDGAGFYSQGIAKLGLDSSITDLQVVVDNRAGSKGISLTPQNNPIYINGSAGLATQVLQSQGAGLPPIWASVGGGGGGTITSVGGGSNIGITGTATDPVVNLLIGQNVIMNNHYIVSCEGISGDSGTSRLTLGDLSAGTHIEIDASATNRITMNPDTLYLDMTGEIRLNNQPGSAGEVLTSQGAGLPPIWTAVAGGGVQNPMTSDLDANNYRITNLDEITPGTSSDLDIALPALGALQVKNAGVQKVSLGGPNVAVFDCTGSVFPSLINASTSLPALANTSLGQYGLLKEAFLNNAINLDGSIDISEPAIVYGTLREKTISLPNIGAGTSYTTDPVKSITVDGKGRITSTTAYLTGPVESVSAGTGISIGGTATNPQINNNGVLNVNAGVGISLGGTPANPQVNNDGVLVVNAGTGITIGGSTSSPQIINNGILSATAGSGISISPGQNPSIANTGVLSLTAGSGISLSGSTGNITVSATGGGGGSGNVFENSANNYSVAEASKTTISAGTISLGNNLGNIVSLGTANTAIGQNTLSYSATPTGTAPQRCVALGSYAHQNADPNAVFADTVVIGTSALENAFGTQQGCVCIGHNAGRSANLSSGVCIGRFAGEFCNVGDDTIIGPYCARAVGGGFGNVAVGLSARDAGSVGSGNVCLGFQAGVNTNGDYNIIIGAGVGQGGYGPAVWNVSKTCCIGYQYDNTSTTGTDAFYMDMSDKTTANGGRASFWATIPAKVQSSQPCFQVAGDSIVSGIFQGASSRIKTGVVSTTIPIPSTGYTTPNILSGRSFTYPYNHNLSSSSGSWKLKVSLKVSGMGVNDDMRCYLELYNNATAGTTGGFLFGTSYQQAVPHTVVGGATQNTIQLEDVFSIGDFSQGDLIDINLYLGANTSIHFFSGGNWVFEYKLVQE